MQCPIDHGISLAAEMAKMANIWLFFYQVTDKHDFDIDDRNIVDKVIG